MMVLEGSSQRCSVRERRTGMLRHASLAGAILLYAVTAHAQLAPSTFGGVPLWADSVLRVEGLGRRFTLSSTLNSVYEVGDFDRDGLADVAVEIKDAAGLRCGIAIIHRIDRSVHIVGAGEPVATGANALACGRWGVQAGRDRHRHIGFRPELLYVTDARGQPWWVVWNGRSYVVIQVD